MDKPDWAARARMEAAAILAETTPGVPVDDRYPTLIALVAMGWLQGANYGSHEALGLLEDAFPRLQADLT